VVYMWDLYSVNVLVCLSVSHRKKIRFANSIPPIDMMPRHNPPLGVLSQPVSFGRHFSSNTTLKIIKHYKLIRKLAQFIDEKFSKLLHSNTNNACTNECRCWSLHNVYKAYKKVKYFKIMQMNLITAIITM
jgi:hypothetical protein